MLYRAFASWCSQPCIKKVFKKIYQYLSKQATERKKIDLKHFHLENERESPSRERWKCTVQVEMKTEQK